jgi:hypothetical protein
MLSPFDGKCVHSECLTLGVHSTYPRESASIGGQETSPTNPGYTSKPDVSSGNFYPGKAA